MKFLNQQTEQGVIRTAASVVAEAKTWLWKKFGKTIEKSLVGLQDIVVSCRTTQEDGVGGWPRLFSA